MKLALFDFDGTITKYDSFLKFIRFVVGDLRFIIGLIILSPTIIFFKLKLIANYKAKQKMFSYFFKDYKQEYFMKVANEYSLNYLDKILRLEAMKRIHWHKEQGHKVIVVSASIDCYLQSWCKKNDLELIATKVEIRNNVITGNFKTKNCYGIEKVNRIKKLYNLEDFEYVYAYGDSSGDSEMLAIANESFYKPFK